MQTEKEKEKGPMVNLVNHSKAFLMGACGIALLHLVDFKLKYRAIWVSFHLQSWTKYSSANVPYQSGEQFHSSPGAEPSKEEQRHVGEDSGKTQAGGRRLSQPCY